MSELAVIYCRKSDPNAKADDPAFEQQEEACRKYCAEKGYAVLAARRESYTGTDLENQAMLWETIDDIRRARASVVVAYSYDRLSREPQMQEVALYEIEKKYGGRFEAATEQINRDDPFREAIRAMLGAASKIERNRITDRMRRGRVDRSAKGGLYGTANPKYGYRWTDDGHKSFEIDEENAKTVRRMFGWMDNGKGIRWIARQLNAEGVPTPSQAAAAQGHIGRRIVGDKWSHYTVWRLLQDPAYCGRMGAFVQVISHEYQKNQATGIMKKKRLVTTRDETDPARIALECPAIVSVEQWNRVHLVLADNNKRREGRPPIDPEAAIMRGHVWCKCGRKMVLSRNHGQYRYRCNAYPGTVADTSQGCTYGSQEIKADLVNEFGSYAALLLAKKADMLQQFLESREQDSQPLRDMVERLKALVSRKTAEHEKWIEAIPTAKNATTMQALVEKADKCAEEVEEAQVSLAEATSRLNSAEQHLAAFDQVINKIRLVTSNGDEPIADEELRNLFDLIGLKVTVSPAHVGNTSQFVMMPVGESFDLDEVLKRSNVRWGRMRAEYNLRGDISGITS
jgi:DNA invertase Pin-like site-specific DNA recombinase